jgi:CheY-like chemotaxis protein
MPRILLVDGDVERLGAVERALVAGGYEVEAATSGSFALTALEWHRPDLVVGHAEIPDVDGYELCSIIRSDPKTKDLPFLLLAGPTGPVAGAAARAGADMVLAGSFNAADVVKSVKRLV